MLASQVEGPSAYRTVFVVDLLILVASQTPTCLVVGLTMS